MRKVVIHIDCPKDWESENDWDSHRPMLYLAMINNKNSVCEFGCGMGSTRLLFDYCKRNKIFFSSYETNKYYISLGHLKKIDITPCNNYNEVHLSPDPHKQGVLFIDLAPGEQRKEIIKSHADHAEVIIVHDTEPGAEYVYGMNEVLSTFKYRLDYTPEGKPHTTAVSNTVNVSEWI